MSEKASWSELPFELQEEFYSLAEGYAERLSKHIESADAEISEAWPSINFALRNIETPKHNDIVIASVDGSRSPLPTRRLGADFAVYSVGSLRVEGRRVVENKFAAGRVDDIGPNGQDLESELYAESVAAERAAAVAALKDADLVLIDGSFYGFSSDVMSKLRRSKVDPSGRWANSTKAALNATRELENSGKCIGVIKRSRTRAIAGWLSHQRKKKSLVRFIDKHILNQMQPAGSVFDYSRLLGGGEFLYFSRLAYNLASGREGEPSEEAFLRAKKLSLERFQSAFEKPFGFSVDISKLKRLQVRMYEASSPCELEIPTSVSNDLVDSLIDRENFSEATGLPFAIDMIDEYVGIPRAFTRDFVQEVEARVASMSPTKLNSVRGFFTGLNPQKEGVE